MRQFLETGCGTGFVLAGANASFPKVTLSGSEVSAKGLVYATNRVPRASFFQMDARSIPFVDEFVAIGAFDVLEHIEEDSLVLRQMYQAARPGDGVVLTVPQHDFLWSRIDELSCHVRHYAAEDLSCKVQAAGFHLERMTSFVSLLLCSMIGARAMQTLKRKECDLLAELRIGRLTNAVLERVVNVESMAIRAGLNFRVGDSLLLVARKTP